MFRAPLLGERAPTARTAGTTVFEDDAVRCGHWHRQGDDVLILSLKTKMHAIGQGVINGLLKAIELQRSKNYQGPRDLDRRAAEGGRSRPAPTCRR